MSKSTTKRKAPRRAPPLTPAEAVERGLTLVDEIPGEEWRRVEGYRNKYEVSSLGRVATEYRGCRILRKTAPHASSGQMMVTLHVGGRAFCKRVLVKMLVAHAFLGKPQKGMRVMVIDQDKANVAASNLKYATFNEIIQHGYDTGRRQAVRPRDTAAKLTAADKESIIRAHLDGSTNNELGRVHNVSNTTIGKFLKRARKAGRIPS